jgi:hypothetical protein
MNLSELGSWTEQFWMFKIGKCYTLDYNGTIGTDIKTEGLHLLLKKNITFDIYIHDLDFFYISHNREALPVIHAKISEVSNDLTLKVTKHILLDKSNRRCEKDPRYSFSTCIQNYHYSRAGCVHAWNSSAGSFPVCKKWEDILTLRSSYKSLLLAEQRQVLLETKCKLPCSYKEYQLLEQIRLPMESPFKHVSVSFATTEIAVHEEKLLYPLISFLAELGGALGMFLGLSCMMVWDFIYYLTSKHSRINLRKLCTCNP